MRKLLNVRYWWRFLVRVWRLLRAPYIPLREKLLFIVPVVIYWMMPDFLSFLPIDDAAVTLLLANWFAGRIEKKYGGDQNERGQNNEQ